ncbi:hypothetical protein BDV12DRAFT_198552 [Aspergillus spectabilis]
MPDQQKYTTKLLNTRVLIIGGTSGLGFGCAEAVLEHGASELILSSSSQSRLNTAISKLKASYPSSSALITGHECNLADEANLASNIQSLFVKIGTLDHIIFTAGDAPMLTPFLSADFPEIKQAGMVRFFAPLLVAKYGYTHLAPGPQSSITLTTGVSGEKPIPGWTVTSSYLSGLQGMIRGLALDLKPIRVNLVSPGGVDTEMWDVLGEEGRRGTVRSLAEMTTTGRVGRVEDVVEGYLFCMRDWNLSGAMSTQSHDSVSPSMIFGKRKKNFRRTPPPRSSRIPIWLLPTLQKAKASMRTLWTPSSVAETAVPVPSPPSPEDTQDVHFISRSRPSARLRALNVDTPTDSSSAGSHNQQNDLIQQNVPRSIPDEKNSPLSPLPPISPVSVDGVGETRVARRIDIVTSIHKLGHRGQGSALRVDEKLKLFQFNSNATIISIQSTLQHLHPFSNQTNINTYNEMPRGVEFAKDSQVSDNAVEAGKSQVHGTNPEHDHINRIDRTAPLPEVTGSSEPYTGQGQYKNPEGSGKGGHEPNTLGEKKGLGAHKDKA